MRPGHAVALLLVACAGPDSVTALQDRCADCHPAPAAEHAASRHAAAGTGELFLALRDHLGDPSACDACHRPLGADGLGCPTCHAAVGNEATADGRLLHHPAGPVQARRDREAPHVVQAGFPADAALCGTCHDSTRHAALREAPYAHWRDSPAAAAGLRCQDCHQRAVPGRPAPDGAVVHAFVGLSDPDAALPLLARAVRLDRAADTLRLTALATGHHLPDGASFLRDLELRVDGELLPDGALGATWTAAALPTDDPRAADDVHPRGLPPGTTRAWPLPPDAGDACLWFTPERPALRRVLGLPVDPARETPRAVVCAP